MSDIRAVAVALISVATGMLACDGGKDLPVSDPEGQSEVSQERKTTIRRFWEVYRKAGDKNQGGAWKEAAVLYREALALDPGHEDTLYYLGNVLFELRNYDEAIAAWQKLAKVNPLSTRAYIQLGSVYSCSAPDAPFDLILAEQAFSQAMALNKEETGPLLKLGEVFLLSGRKHRALNHFEMAVRSNFRSVEAYYLIGYLKWLDRERDAALEALEQAVRFSTEQPIGMGEGDTKSKGFKPILSGGVSVKSFFAPHWMALETWSEEKVTLSQMAEEYRKLDIRLKGFVEGRM